MKTTAQIMAALLLLAGCGGSESPPPAAAKQEQVAATARRLANERAQALYRCQPFEVDRAPQWTNRHWVWRDRRGYGGGDVEAIVSLAPDLSTQSVQVLLLDSRTIEF